MPEDNMNEIIQNWSTMSMEDLGSSLLDRKAKIEKSARKKARKDEKIEMAMGVLMAGQSIFSNAGNNRIKEMTELGKYDQLQATAQAPALNQMSDLYKIMYGLEDRIQTSTGDEKFKLTKENYMDYVKSNPEFAQQFNLAIQPNVKAMFTKSGFPVEDINTTRFNDVQNQLLPDFLGKMIDERENFETGLTELYKNTEHGTKSYEELLELTTGIVTDDLKLYKAKKLNQDIAQVDAQKRKLFNGKNITDSLSALGFMQEKDGQTNIFKKKEIIEEAWEETMNRLSVDKVLESQMTRILADPANKDYAAKGADDEATITSMSSILDNIETLQETGQAEVGYRKQWRLLGINQLRDLTQELDKSENINTTKVQLLNRSSALYNRLKTDFTFKEAFFDGDAPDDPATVMQAALIYTIGVSVKPEGPLGGTMFSGKRLWGGNNFEYDWDKVDRTIKKFFSVEDGQFKAEQAWYKLKDVDKLGAIQDEYRSIIKNTRFSLEDKKLLTERLVDDVDLSNKIAWWKPDSPFYTGQGGMLLKLIGKGKRYDVFDLSQKKTNEELVDILNSGVDIEEAMLKLQEAVQPDVYGGKIRSRRHIKKRR